MRFLANHPPVLLGFLLFASVIIILCDSFLSEKYTRLGGKHNLIFAIIILALSILCAWINQLRPNEKQYFLNGHFLWDPLSAFLGMCIVGITILVFLYAYMELSQYPTIMTDYYLLGILSTFGMLVLTFAGSLLTLYLGLEIMSLPLYAMICLNREKLLSAEGAMKYIIINILGSILLLYAFSILYSFNHSLFLADLSVINNTTPLLHIAVLLLVITFALKLGSVPFHFWMPDVYQSAPLSATLFLSAAPKIAVLGIGLRLLVPYITLAKPLLFNLGLLSIIAGNLMALVQSNLKRLFAYASIAHLGFVLLSLALPPEGYTQALFYSISYTLMIIPIWGILSGLARNGYNIELSTDLKGLHHAHTQFTFSILVVLIAMIGLPPFIGFFAKLGVLQLLIRHHAYIIACTLVLANVIGGYYYFNLIKLAYFETAPEVSTISVSKNNGILPLVLYLNVCILLLLGIFPDRLIQYCETVVRLSLMD